MRIIIQSQTTRRYLKAPDSWSRNSKLALDFKTFIPALKFCRGHPEFKPRVLVDSGDRPYDLAIG